MIVEPFAHDQLAANLNPIGSLYYAASTMACETPASLPRRKSGLVWCTGWKVRLRQVVRAGGFTRFRRAAETPFNIVLEAWP